ncbi:UNVERIFIED_ORG: hypothetical protein J3D58_002947 [Paenarthrobacter nicotinovorans]
MRSIKTKIISGMGAAAVAATFMIGGASVAQAASCGFQGKNNEAYDAVHYNHCGSGNVYVQIDYWIGTGNACLGPGMSSITSFPWNRVQNVFAVGSC